MVGRGMNISHIFMLLQLRLAFGEEAKTVGKNTSDSLSM